MALIYSYKLACIYYNSWLPSITLPYKIAAGSLNKVSGVVLAGSKSEQKLTRT